MSEGKNKKIAKVSKNTNDIKDSKNTKVSKKPDIFKNSDRLYLDKLYPNGPINDIRDQYRSILMGLDTSQEEEHQVLIQRIIDILEPEDHDVFVKSLLTFYITDKLSHVRSMNLFDSFGFLREINIDVENKFNEIINDDVVFRMKYIIYEEEYNPFIDMDMEDELDYIYDHFPDKATMLTLININKLNKRYDTQTGGELRLISGKYVLEFNTIESKDYFLSFIKR